MICVSIAESDFERCRARLDDCALAELRLDQADFSAEQIRQLCARPVKIVATCRPGTQSEPQRQALLLAAIAAGAAYVDIEVDAGTDYRHRIADLAREHGCRLIVSHHDPDRTPPLAELEAIVARCFQQQADIAKIVCRAHTAADCARLLSLYQQTRDIIALGLGNLGTFTRVAALFLGAPFTYAAAAPGAETADGQLDRQRLQSILDALR